MSRHAHAPLRGSRWRWLLVVWLLLSTTASAAKPPHEVRFVGADPSGRLCVRTSAGTLLRLSRHRRGLEGEVVGACARQLAPGPAPRTSVWLVSSKPKHRIPLTLDVSGSVVYNTITPDRVKMRRDRAYRQLIEALRRGGGRELVLLRGRHTVRLAQLHRGPVQFLRLRAQHEPKTSTTTLRLF
ncbi:MAG: hypothetical protein KC609_22625, partial [Myxococcales bacterium]|nr:hypothetical protein [Myxococcales bacterium]